MRGSSNPLMRYEHPDFSVDLPPDWSAMAVAPPDPADAAADESDDAPAEPVAFAKADGVGVLQVTAALHPPGERTLADGAEMRAMLDNYATARGFAGRPTDPASQDRPVALAAGTYAAADGLVERAWCVSADGSVAFVTYACPAAEPSAKEFAEADAIARSIRFAVVADGDG